MGILKRVIRRIPVFYRRFGWAGLSMLYRQKCSTKEILPFHYRKEFRYPVFIRKGVSDFPVFESVLVQESYNIDFGFTPEVIFDCGANIGLTTVFYANRFPQAKIISIEPESSNFELLKMNAEHFSNVALYRNGLWNKLANLKIEDKGYGKWGFMVSEISEETPDTIKAISILDVMQREKIDYIDVLKIDIEGSEKEVFESNYEEWMPKVKVIIIELHDRMREGCSKSFFTALTKYNFSLSQKSDNLICFMK